MKGAPQRVKYTMTFLCFLFFLSFLFCLELKHCIRQKETESIIVSLLNDALNSIPPTILTPTLEAEFFKVNLSCERSDDEYRDKSPARQTYFRYLDVTYDPI
jgi:hypothetical protein